MRMRESRHRAVKIIVQQFRDRLPDIVQEALAAVGGGDRDTRHRGQPVYQIISPAPTEFGAKDGRPVLTAAFPTVDMEDLQYPSGQFRAGLPKGFAEPVIELYGRGLGIELVAFEPLTSTSCGIDMSS